MTPNEDYVLANTLEKTGKDVNYAHPASSGYSKNSFQFGIITLVLQCFFIILFAVFIEYDPAIIPTLGDDPGQNITADYELTRLYPWFQDIHIMIVVGIGFLLTFLKRYGWSSVGFNFLFTALTIQWSILVAGMFHNLKHYMKEAAEGNMDHAMNWKIEIDMNDMIEADFTCGTILISFCAVLGVASPVQAIIMLFLEVIFYNLNTFILTTYLQINDMGGSMVIHTFACYFGLAVAKCLYRPGKQIGNEVEASEYHSDLFAMVGTVFLWCFWPSFNSAPGIASNEHRYIAIINTYLALCASCVATFITSNVFNPKKKLTMAHVQNASLAGGVAMGTACNMAVQPFGALAIGFSGGFIATVGFSHIQPFITSKLNLHDACGVNNLHGMPSIIACLASIFMSVSNPQPFFMDKTTIVSWQNQLFSLLCTIGVSTLTGAVTGFVLRMPFIESLTDYEYFEDGKYWDMECDSEDEDETKRS